MHFLIKTNPSDFFLDTITIDRRTAALAELSSSRIKKFVTAFDQIKETRFQVVEKVVLSGQQKTIWKTTIPIEVMTLVERNLVNDFRDPGTIGAGFGSNIFIMIITSVLFLRVTNDAAGIQNRLGAFFFLTLNLTFGIIAPS